MRIFYTEEMRKWRNIFEPYMIRDPGKLESYLDPNAPDYVKDAKEKFSREIDRIFEMELSFMHS